MGQHGCSGCSAKIAGVLRKPVREAGPIPADLDPKNLEVKIFA